ncbi:MAG: 50S ribosomal protein L6 [Bacilli bacterium]|nr:50S ribosomal protein L6 [Bacilli bacterium]
MSRIGNRKLQIPAGVEVTLDGNKFSAKSNKGELSLSVSPLVQVEINEGTIETKVANSSERANVLSGTTNSLISNMLTGLSAGYTKNLEIIGVGYRFNVQGSKIVINAGYSHPVEMVCPEGIKATLVNANEISLEGIDKQKVSEFAAKVREIRPPEPYKGKGIRYKDEHIRRKEGKKAAK